MNTNQNSFTDLEHLELVARRIADSGAKGNHALAFFQAVGKLLVALVAFVAWVLTANQVITLACPLAKRGTGKGNGHPRLVIAGKVGTAVGNAAGHELKVLKVGK